MYMYFYILRIAEVLEQVLKISQNLNSEEEDMVVVVAALNFIKRKQKVQNLLDEKIFLDKIMVTL